MNIKDFRIKQPTLDELDSGEVFIYNSEVFMRTSFDLDNKNSIRLSDGEMFGIACNAYIIIIDAELIINQR